MLKNLFKITATALLFFNLSCNATEINLSNTDKFSSEITEPNQDLDESKTIAIYTSSGEVEQSNINTNSKKLSSNSINYILVFSSLLLLSVVAGSIFIHNKNKQS